MPPFVPRQRKHKVLARQGSQKSESANSNQVQIVPTSRSEREERKQKLKEELRANLPKISSKKQKRLDKYVDNKLKKEEKLDLLKKLSQNKFDTSLLQSSRHLGKRKHVVGPAIAEEVRQPKKKKTKRVETERHDLSDVESEDSFEQNHTDAFKPVTTNGYEVVIEPPTLKVTARGGSGLKQPLELGEDGLPVIQMLHKKKKTKLKPVNVVELPWEGFDSEEDDLEDSVDDNSNLSEDGNEDEDEDEDENEGEDHDDDDDMEDLSEDEESGSSTGLSSSDDEDESSLSEVSDGEHKLKPRASAFKAWAVEQINKSLDYTPAQLQSEMKQPEPTNITAPTPSSSFEPTAENITQHVNDRKVYSVQVERSPSIQEARMNLPIVAEEQKIMEAIHNNSVVIVYGATGSGKTTQVPQFLFEAGYGSPASSTPGMIGVTQPRRVAAVSMANRVKEELGEQGKKVSYQIRFESTVSNQTAIKFMTDGILMRELSQDLLLRKYSAILIDEAHERSVNTDILIGILSRIVPKRAELSRDNPEIRPLKLVIMSATLRTSDFLSERLFKASPPPLVQAEGRQYSVTDHFSRTTQRDYLEEVVRKVSKGHRKLPQGGILVFLTGQNEIKAAIDRLQTALAPGRSNVSSARVQLSAKDMPMEAEDLEIGDFDDGDELSDVDIIVRGDDDDDDDNEFDVEDLESESTMEKTKIPPIAHMLPLYSQLPTNEQLRVFEPLPSGARLIVLATNVAETSLTIPGIRYVFDAGRSKERVFDQTTGVQSFEINWISKASAEQRKGRAGRTGPGHCYRLYSSAVYERDFPEHADPEILRTPSESVVLQVKGFHFPGNVANFPFPSAPSQTSLVKAEKLLANIGALTAGGDITELGRELSVYPLSPRLGKMIILGLERQCLSSIVSLVSGLAVGRPSYTQKDHEEDERREKRRQDYGRARATLSKGDKFSDAGKLLMAMTLYAQASNKKACCQNFFLRSRAIKEADQLRSQLISMIRTNHADKALSLNSEPRAVSAKESKTINEIITSGFIDQLAIRADLAPSPPAQLRKPKRAIDVPYLPLIPLRSGPTTHLEEKAIYLHPSSVLARLPPKDLPRYIVYSHLQQSQPSNIGTPDRVPKTRMFPLTGAIDGSQLADLACDTLLLRYGKPIGQVTVLPGTQPKRQECWVTPELGGGNGVVGWPLPPRKVVQMRDLKRGWIVEKLLT